MRIISEYEPVSKIYLSFVHEFFNTRFKYGKFYCDIIKAIGSIVEIEIFISPEDEKYLIEEFENNNINKNSVIFNYDSPKRGILYEYIPFFAQSTDNKIIGILFSNKNLNKHDKLKEFSLKLLKKLRIKYLDIDKYLEKKKILSSEINFATAGISVSDNLCLLADCYFKRNDVKINFFKENFPKQNFEIVKTLYSDITLDLDMFLWPIRPQVWIVSQYQKNSLYEKSIESTLQVLKKYKHKIHRVPGLKPIIYDDINTIPNYTNGVILNNIALCPKYNIEEDNIIVDILEHYNYKVHQIDSRDVILSNSAMHCLSKTLPDSNN